MGAIAKYFLDLARFTPKIILGDTEKELRMTLEALSTVRVRLQAKATMGFDRIRASEMAYLAGLAYQVKDLGERAIATKLTQAESGLASRYRLVGPIENPDAVGELVFDAGPRGFVAECGEDVVVALKGSSDLFDWAVNTKFYEGYAVMALWIWAQFGRTITAGGRKPKRRIVLTGHSLGGAVARVASWALAKTISAMDPPRPVIEAFTYGRPQVGGSPQLKHPFEYEGVPEYRFGMAGDLVAGFGIGEDTEHLLMIGKQGEIYLFDHSREARLLRLFEIVRAARGKRGVHEPLLRIILAKIREALTNSEPLEEDVILSMEQQNFPHTVFMSEHKIETYAAALRGL